MTSSHSWPTCSRPTEPRRTCSASCGHLRRGTSQVCLPISPRARSPATAERAHTRTRQTARHSMSTDRGALRRSPRPSDNCTTRAARPSRRGPASPATHIRGSPPWRSGRTSAMNGVRTGNPRTARRLQRRPRRPQGACGRSPAPTTAPTRRTIGASGTGGRATPARCLHEPHALRPLRRAPR